MLWGVGVCCDDGGGAASVNSGPLSWLSKLGLDGRGVGCDRTASPACPVPDPVLPANTSHSWRSRTVVCLSQGFLARCWRQPHGPPGHVPAAGCSFQGAK